MRICMRVPLRQPNASSGLIAATFRRLRRRDLSGLQISRTRRTGSGDAVHRSGTPKIAVGGIARLCGLEVDQVASPLPSRSPGEQSPCPRCAPQPPPHAASEARQRDAASDLQSEHAAVDQRRQLRELACITPNEHHHRLHQRSASSGAGIQAVVLATTPPSRTRPTRAVNPSGSMGASPSRRST